MNSMAPPEDAQGFLGLVSKSGLLEPRDVDTIVRKYEVKSSTPTVELARAFVHDKVLTVFQARQLLKGKWRGLCVGKYKLLYPLGSGGMGYVYAAEEAGTGWQVAVKVMSDRYRKDIAMLTRIQLEAQAGMRLKHPNILRTWSIDRTEDSQGDMYYVVMELVKGVSLNELILLEKSISVGRACDIVYQAAQGLQHAHDHGLVHRDVKPENLLIRSDGSVKMLDFGLAMIDENDEEFVMAMVMGQDRLGTADYVAPEQSINSYKVDARADIYSLGGTLYFALAGHPPFPVDSAVEKIRSHREIRPQPILELRPEIPKRVALIIHKMLAKRPENRIQTATEVVQLLEPFAQRESLTFDFPWIIKARAKWGKRREMLRQARERDDTATQAQSQTQFQPRRVDSPELDPSLSPSLEPFGESSLDRPSLDRPSLDRPSPGRPSPGRGSTS
jgi:eukaryotic-like serine/threonine-protein kinase